jgi:hypothetical protein
VVLIKSTVTTLPLPYLLSIIYSLVAILYLTNSMELSYPQESNSVVKKFLAFCGPKCLLLCFQEPATGLRPEPDEFSSQHLL